MRQMVGQIIKMRGALWVNAFLYYFSRLWMVGRLVPPTAYAGYRAKKALSAAAVAVRQIIDLCGKPLYLLTFLLLPVILLAGSRPQFAGQEFSLFLSMLFFLSCILGAFGDSHIFNVTREKVAFLKYLHADARSYIQASLALRYVPFFSYYLPFLLLAAWLFGAPLWQGAAAWVLLAAFRMMSEAFHLFVFDRTGRVLVRNTGYAWLVIAVGLAGAYAPPLLGLDWHMGLAAFLLHPASISAFAAAGALCLYYIAAGYPGYARKLPRSLDLNFLLSSMLKTASGLLVQGGGGTGGRRRAFSGSAGKAPAPERVRLPERAVLCEAPTAAAAPRVVPPGRCGAGLCRGRGAAHLQPGTCRSPEPEPDRYAPLLCFHHVQHHCGG